MMTTTKKTAKKPAEKTAKKPAKKPAKKLAKKPAKKPAASAVVTVASITPSADGARWTLSLSNARRVRVSSAAAQAVSARVGMRWTDAARAKIAAADLSQRAFTRAMALLMKRPGLDRATLERLLGGDRAAGEAVRSLAANGWV